MMTEAPETIEEDANRRSRWKDGGYVAVMFAILTPVLFGIAALVVDVGQWYTVANSVQRSADAAALGGVTYMPGSFTNASSTAIAVAARNGWSANSTTTIDPEPVPGQPSQLQVTITTKVNNIFGVLIGVPTTTITRTAVANYQAPLAMGSPCNQFGNAPNTANGSSLVSANCSSVAAYWANVGSPKASKSYGDAYQDGDCTTSASGTDGCSNGNTDYSTNGYYYTLTLTQAVSNLTISAFDPAFVNVGDQCTATSIASNVALSAKNDFNYSFSADHKSGTYTEDPNLYAAGPTSPYCTGDQIYTQQNNQPPDTTFTIRQPAANSSQWDPTTFPVVSGCTPTFKGYNSPTGQTLNDALTEYTATGAAAPNYNATVAGEFRQWVTLCTISNAQPGTYFIQVQTNAAGDNPLGDGHNRFSLRATSGNTGIDQTMAISGYTDIGVYANATGAVTKFYLTRVPPGAAGQILDLRLFDVGDASQPGTITIQPPSDSGLTSFTGCTGTGPASGSLSGCSFTANSSFNGKWQSVAIPIPTGYTCNLASQTGCWITLRYDYGALTVPSDTTSWQASLEGTPVRITQ